MGVPNQCPHHHVGEDILTIPTVVTLSASHGARVHMLCGITTPEESQHDSKSHVDGYSKRKYLANGQSYSQRSSGWVPEKDICTMKGRYQAFLLLANMRHRLITSCQEAKDS